MAYYFEKNTFEKRKMQSKVMILKKSGQLLEQAVRLKVPIQRNIIGDVLEEKV